MKAGIKLAAAVTLLILSGTVLGESVCPKIKFIKTETLSATFAEDGLYYAYHVSTYKTELSWGFIMGPFYTDSERDALRIANRVLNNMTMPGVLNRYGACNYDTGYPELEAVARINTANLSIKH